MTNGNSPLSLEVEDYSGSDDAWVPGVTSGVAFDLTPIPDPQPRRDPTPRTTYPTQQPQDTGIVFDLVPDTDPPIAPTPGEVFVEVPLTKLFNAWKYTFTTVDASTGASINAKVFIDGEDTGKWTPYYFYLAESTSYVFRFERYGYETATVPINTGPL